MPRVAARAGAPMWAGEPFGENLLSDLTGRVEFTASRAALTPTLIARQLRGALRIEPAEIAIEKLEGVARGRPRQRTTGAAARCRRARRARSALAYRR